MLFTVLQLTPLQVMAVQQLLHYQKHLSQKTVVDNVIQQPTTNFTVSGTTLTIVGTAILSGITGYAIHTGGALPIGEASGLSSNILTKQTDIGAAIVDADLFLVDDGAGGTLRKVTASRIKTYAGTDLDAAVTINDSGAAVDFRVEGDTKQNLLFVDGSADKVGINTNAPDMFLDITGTVDAGGGSDEKLQQWNINSDNVKAEIEYLDASANRGYAIGTSSQHDFFIRTHDTIRLKVHYGGDITIGRTAADLTVAGISLEAAGTGGFVRDNGPCVIANRLSNDGEIIRIVQDGTTEGTISTSGSTVSYNAFTGSHWSRLADNSKPTILRGTIMESLDSMIDWYQAVNSDGTVKKEIALPNGKSVGDAVTFTHYGTEYTGVYAKENDVKHVHSKISTTADSTRVYGVFHCWGYDNIDDVNDMEIAQVGTYIIRVNKDVTVAAGDLLVSNGDGTAKKQDDDIIRSKTVAKVNSNIKVETYSDGSYTVPCTLHC